MLPADGSTETGAPVKTDASEPRDGSLTNIDSAAGSCTSGASCPTPGASCTDPTGEVCACQGPAGSSFVFCQSEASSIVFDGSVASDDGSSSTADAGVSACSGSAPWSSSGTPAVSITVDASQQVAAWSRYYEYGVASDHANTVLSTAWGRNIQNALKKGHDQAGFQYVRFHGILDSDIGVYTENNGTPVYVWTRFDGVYDAIVAAGMRPVLEVSFMPPPLAS
jgi:hypothetical protein